MREDSVFVFIVQLLRAYQMVLNETETWLFFLNIINRTLPALSLGLDR